MIGEGKYDKECTELREKTQAACAIAVIISGLRGSGFSCQVAAEHTVAAKKHMKTLAKALRTIADSMETHADAIDKNDPEMN